MSMGRPNVQTEICVECGGKNWDFKEYLKRIKRDGITLDDLEVHG